MLSFILAKIALSVDIPDCSVAGKLTCTFDETTGDLSINGVAGNADDIKDSEQESIFIAYKDKIKSVTITDPVKTIGKNSFNGFTNLKTVKFGDYLHNINENAFKGCTGLNEIGLGSNTFKIQANAFSGCANVKKVSLRGPDTTIDPTAFSGCNKIESVKLWDGVKDQIQLIFPDSKGIITKIEVSVHPDFQIPAKAFQNLVSLTEITGLGTLYEIGELAFDGCVKLSSISLSKSEIRIGSKAFNGCVGLKSITISGNPTSIEADSFKGCNQIETVTFTSYLTKELQLMFPDSVNKINKVALYERSPIPDKAFQNLVELTEVINIEKVEEVGANAFDGCIKLKEVEFTASSGVRSIGANAFKGCVGLTRVILTATPNIAADAFSGCTNIEKVKINEKFSVPIATIFPDSATKIQKVIISSSITMLDAKGMFTGCTNLKEILYFGTKSFHDIDVGTIPDATVVYVNKKDSSYPYPDDTFGPTKPVTRVNSLGDFIWEYDTTDGINKLTITGEGDFPSYRSPFETKCDGMKSAEISEGITSIGSEAFSGFTTLETVKIPSTVKVIGSSAFSGCTNLNVVLPDGITTIESYAFNGCLKIVKLDLSKYTKLTKIGENAFKECANINEVILPLNLEILERYAFTRCEKIKSVTIPGDATYGSDIFDARNIGTITVIGDTLTADVSNIFSYSGSFTTKINLPEGIKSIPQGSFNWFSELQSLVIPSSVESIPDRSFVNCYKLATITYYGSHDFSELVLGENACRDVEKVKVNVKSNYPNTKFAGINVTNVDETGGSEGEGDVGASSESESESSEELKPEESNAGGEETQQAEGGNAGGDESNEDNNGLSGGAIAGITIGVIAFVGIIAGVVVYFVVIKKKNSVVAADP